MNSMFKEHLQELLLGGSAHLNNEAILRNFPIEWIGEKPNGFAHSAWQLLEHIRIAQSDIINYCLDPINHVSPNWPDEYWPQDHSPEKDEDWNVSVDHFVDDLNRMIEMINQSDDLFSPLLSESSHTLCREAMLLADHNSYHLGQIVLVQKCLNSL